MCFSPSQLDDREQWRCRRESAGSQPSIDDPCCRKIQRSRRNLRILAPRRECHRLKKKIQNI
ncbi:unnamed protein product [Nippostrongylus brasiliensis]|uniref:Uncharacterized protein n=1 Tax=Nippostrongylus brasiliensis TaxID=27835 RepID=A0A0N4XSF0_NIPBR|nr:unnamed protein product [Nippostrongylus brasiliensis]